MKRIVTPEILDELPPEDARAQHSRDDLARVNRWMGNARIIEEHVRLSAEEQRPIRIVELGAGDGQFMLQLAELLGRRFREAEVWLVDQHAFGHDKLPERLPGLDWNFRMVPADVFDWLKSFGDAPVDLMFANLFLHHFSEDKLRRLLEMAAAKTRCFMGCEPRRGWLPLLITKLLWVIGCNRVTRHDAALSVRAGFIGQELSARWPAGGWELWEGERGLFTHAFVASLQISHPGDVKFAGYRSC